MSDLHEMFKNYEEQLKKDPDLAKAEKERFKREYPAMADLPNQVAKMMGGVKNRIEHNMRLDELIQRRLLARDQWEDAVSGDTGSLRQMIDARELPDELPQAERLKVYREKATGYLKAMRPSDVAESVSLQSAFEEFQSW